MVRRGGRSLHSRRRVVAAVALALGLPWASGGVAHGSTDLHVEFQARLAECPPEDIPGRLRLIEWALAADLPGEADALYRAILAREPQHDEAYRGLLRLAQQHAPPADSPAFQDARRLLPRRFRQYETDRFILLSDAGRRWTRARGNLLERTCEEFQRSAEMLGLRPLPLRHKLVCVLFEHREDFAAFAAAHDKVSESWCLGYYSPRHDRTAFFRAETEPDADEFAEARSIAATIHEAIHQLSFHTRVQTRYVQYPLWSVEGYATAFETASPKAAFGPDHDFSARRERFERLLRESRLIPLRELVRLDTLPDGNRSTIHTVYGQSYALVTWMVRHRREALRDYFNSMLVESPGRPGPDRQAELFEAAFGDVNRLEEAWLRDELAACGLAVTHDAIATQETPP